MLITCSSKDGDPSPGDNVEVGTYAGNIQVADDPQTELGYILNVKVAVSIKGSAATVKVTGNPGFDREFSGSVTSQSSGIYDISLTKQTRPAEKIAGERVIIMNNKLTISVDLANDEVSVYPSANASTNFVISGKLQLIGTDLLKQ